MPVYLGVDPGLSGAYAVLDVHADGTQTVRVVAAPVVGRAVNGKRRRQYDVGVLLGQLQALGPIAIAYLEDQAARPGQGVTSTFSIGFGLGLWTALLAGCAIPFQTVTPQHWRKRVGLAAQPRGTKKTMIKAGVQQAAARRFPTVTVKRDHADAIMIAVAAALEHRP